MSIPHRPAVLIPLAALSLLFLSACGNKGPLVMPQKPVPVEEQVIEPADEAGTEGADVQEDATLSDDASATDHAPPVVPDPVEPQLDDDDGNE